MVFIDNEKIMDEFARAAASHQALLSVLVDVDVGLHRCGVPPGEPAACLARAAVRKGLPFRGLVSYEGQLLRKLPGAEREQAVAAAMRPMIETAEALRPRGDRYGNSERSRYGHLLTLWAFTGHDGGLGRLVSAHGHGLPEVLHRLRTYNCAHVGARQNCRGTDRGGYRLEKPSCERGIPTVKDMPALSVRRLTAEHGIIDIKDPATPVEVGEKIEI
jgi:D-serine deaminase-like pyridoxal phosphate-dependent protein